MSSFSKMILIHAPVSVVWGYLENPLHILSMNDHVARVQDIQPSVIGGYNCTLIYDLNGHELNIGVEIVEFVPQVRFVLRTQTGLKTHQVWTIQDEGGATSVNVTLDYQLDVPVLGYFASYIAARLGEADMEKLLLSVKDICEALATINPNTP